LTATNHHRTFVKLLLAFLPIVEKEEEQFGVGHIDVVSHDWQKVRDFGRSE